MDIALTYYQSTGKILDPEGLLVATGWAGRGEAKNQPTCDHMRCEGPLPKGVYVVGVWDNHPRLGPMVAPLTQISGETHGRSAFFFHGPSSNPAHEGQESMGCIVVPRPGRVEVKKAAPEGSYVQVVA